MIFVHRTSAHRSFSERASRAPQVIDLSPGEWEEVRTDDARTATRPAEARGSGTIASAWIVAILLLAAIAAAPVVEAAARHTT